MNFDLDQLRAFDAVMRIGNFRAAAEAVGTAQSSLSQQITRLEDQLGRKLFTRTTRRVEPTPAGRALQAYARSMLSIAEETRRHFEEPPIDGVLRLGVVEDFVLSDLHLVLSLFRQQHSRFGLSVRTGLSRRLAHDLDRGDLDVVLVKRLPGRSLGRLLYSRALVWCGEAEAVANGPDAAVPIVTYPEPSVTREMIGIAMRRAGRAFAVVAESEGMAGIQAAVDAGFGVAALGDGFIPAGMKRLLASCGLPALDAIEYVVDQSAHPRSGAVDAFAEMLIATATALSDEP